MLNTAKTETQSNVWGDIAQGRTCSHCGVSFVVSLAKENTPLCPNCLQGKLEPVDDETAAQIMQYPPEAVLPFKLTPEGIRYRLEQFIKSIPFKPVDLTLEHLSERLTRVYMPVWWVDADVQGQWKAELGFDYEVLSHREIYDGGWHTQEVKEKRIRWEPRVGTVQRHYDNIMTPALEDMSTFQQRVGSYKLGSAEDFRPEHLDGTLLRLPQRSPQDAWEDAIPGLQRSARDECQQACEAQHIREFQWTVEHHNQEWTQMLLPLYLSYYINADGQRHWVMINGQNGQLAGERRANLSRAAWISGLALLAAFLLFLISGVGILLGGTLGVLGAVLFFIAAGIALGGLIPFGWSWWFNYQQPERDPTALA